MNVALIYRGFYKRDSYKISIYNKRIKKTNSFTEEILKNNIDSIKTLDIKNIDIYFHTYSVNDDEDKKMLSIFEKYNIKKYIFEKDIKNDRTYSIRESLKLVDNDDDYDIIINTRFDMYFIKPLSEFGLKKIYNPIKHYVSTGKFLTKGYLVNFFYMLNSALSKRCDFGPQSFIQLSEIIQIKIY